MLNFNKLNNESYRYNYNCVIFILAYIFIGAVRGIINDSFVSFLQLTSPNITKGLPIYFGISLFSIALITLFIPKLGYKKLMLISPIVLITSLIATIYNKNILVLPFYIIIINIGMRLFGLILPLVLTSYTRLENRTLMFSRALYTNIAGMALTTVFDGKLVVLFFSKNLHISYTNADELTKSPNLLTKTQMTYYISSYKHILLIACFLSLIAFFILLLLKEKQEDYREVHKKFEFNLHVFKDKRIISWLFFSAIMRGSSSLIIPFMPVYLNQILHINRDTTSTILTFRCFAMVIFIMLAPKIINKLGSIKSLVISITLSIPPMIIIANGKYYSNMVYIIIGLALFLRSGLINACSPVRSSLPMTFVTKNLRPAYNSTINALNSITTIIAGIFARCYLLKTASGYGYAYYITSFMYIIAISILYFVFINHDLSENKIVA